MSRLKELRLHGFKSFADPTRFVFEPGVNAVIGPNGSGKSNMADAVRWVLGEQSNRSLRTRRSDDVIFAGSDARRAQGMAEAVLMLDNADGWLPIEFAEVAIGRRAFRSGESEYLINGARARLRDVVELLGEGRLGANELVVVGQGTIDAALSLRPEERRQLFEEAAGVKNLQVRRNEASSSLAKARDNLSRVADLVAELKPQVRRLALQAHHQQEHDTLGRRAAALVSETHRRRATAARSELGDARRLAAAAEAALDAYRGEQAAARSAAAAAEERYWQAEATAREAAASREATREALVRAEARHESAALRLDEARRRLAAGHDELAAAERDLSRLAGAAPHDDVPPAIAAAAAAEERWREAVGRLAAADAAMLAAEEALAAARHGHSQRIAADARRSEDAAREEARREAATAERAAAIARLAAARAAHGAAEEQVRLAEATADDARRGLEGAAARRDGAQAAADEARRRSTELGELLGVRRAELAALVDGEARSGGLSTELRDHGWASLLDVLEAPEEAWQAIEALVGGELEQALLWRDADLTMRAADARGSVRLLAPETGRHRGARAMALGAVGATRTVAEWVGSDRAPAVLHQAVVAPDLNALLRGWQGLPEGWCAVTPNGDVGDARGVLLLRGRAEPPGGATTRARARRRELTEIVGRLESERNEATEAAHAAAEELRRARDAHVTAHDRLDAADRAARSAHREQEAAADAEARLAGEVRRLGEEVHDLEQDARETNRTSAVPGFDLAPLERTAAEARRGREAAAAARDAARAAWNATRGAAEEAERRASGQRQDGTLLAARLPQLRAELPALADAIAALEADVHAATRAVDDARGADDDIAARRAQADEAREARRRELLELERGTGMAGDRLAELERAAQATAVEVSRREEALAALGRERELSLEGLPLGSGIVADAPPDVELAAAVSALDSSVLDAELGRVRRTLAQIGSVNPFAVEEHRELATRLEGMTTQEADLGSAIASTEELIARLDGEITAKFDDAFHAIGERFDEYCQLLFAGGSASLQRADDGDGDAPGGIEIVVRPPGKRLQRLAMLSGGERALTGVALLFAMLSVNPVPFCILDEVDAALDEANIGRFAAALRRLAEAIDFVVITHNRATIEIADTIYGVTMTDAAVSRVLSLRLADVPVEATA